MELRRITICLAVFVLAVFTHCSEARHAMQRRDADYNFDDSAMGDEASEDEAQNDAEDNEAEPPSPIGTITNAPEHYNVTVGKAVQLECRVTPSEDVVIFWLKDGQQYFLGTGKQGAPDRASIASKSHDLIIKDLQPSDSGMYTCGIMQTPPVSINHTVLVTESPRITRFTASDGGNITEGHDLLLTCDVAGSPKPEILWSRIVDGAAQRLTEKDGQFSSNTFFARNVQREMSGKYLCYAINSVGHSEAYATIIVSGKPRVHVHKTVVNSDIGVEAILQCSVHEESNPHIRWYKDGRLIEDSSASTYVISSAGSTSSLNVIPKVDQDFGTFTCEAENRHGKHNRSIELVQSPVIENIGVDGTKLSWTVHSHQPLQEIEVQLRSLGEDGVWKTIQVPLPETGNEKKHEYEIIYPLEKQLEAGKYEATVKVKNDKSWSAHSEPKVVEIENQPQPIITASVFRTNNAHSIRPTTTAILSTTLMYLLVRML